MNATVLTPFGRRYGRQFAPGETVTVLSRYRIDRIDFVTIQDEAGRNWTPCVHSTWIKENEDVPAELPR